MDNTARRCVCGATDWDDLGRHIQCRGCGRRELHFTPTRFTAHLTGRPYRTNPNPTLAAWLKAGAR